VGRWAGRNAANAFRAQIGQLRRTLGATAIVTSEAGFALDVGPDDLDAARFELLVAKGLRLLQEGETSLASSTLRQAASVAASRAAQ
jgi:2-methylisocitrate lyase-like PEP mutase family enzyme